MTVRFVPSWFPGAYFQKEAKQCRELLHDMVSVRYKDAVERCVSPVFF